MNNDRVASLEKAILEIPCCATIVSRLTSELDPKLIYHSARHTLDTLHEAILFAVHDKLSDREISVLGAACLFHDAGFLVKAQHNEEIGSSIAREALTADGYFTAAEIDDVCTMILDTEFHGILSGDPQGNLQQDMLPLTLPRTILSGYLLDADVSNFGREDFFEKGSLICAENNLRDDIEFKRKQCSLLERHRWHTPAARSLREAQKQKNLQLLQSLIGND